LITGATGTLGQAFARVCGKRGLAYHLLSREQLNISSQASVVAALNLYEPWSIINTAGYVRVDDAEGDAATCERENVSGPACLARECASRQLPLVTFSSDLVFDGLKGAPYVESDAPSPLNVYGLSKATAEKQVLEEFPQALVIRTSAFFGPWDEFNFVYSVLNDLSLGRKVVAADDLSISPTYVPDLVNATLDLLIDGEQGIWHLANRAEVTWAELAGRVALKAGYQLTRVQGKPSHSMGFVASRPSFTALSSERGNFMPFLDDSLDAFLKESNWSRHYKTALAGG
jgi:dTDP-4-dehydrorhamnose reductase